MALIDSPRFPRIRRRVLCSIGTAAAWLASPLAGATVTGARPAGPLVAAASDLKFALEEIATGFSTATGDQPRLVFGSSGQFSRQIERGAPFELFLSADEALVNRLTAAGRTIDSGSLYAIGHLSILVPHGSSLRADPELLDLGDALRDGRLRHFAIANPGHAPYGLAAREVLERVGLWPAIQPRLVIGENVAQAAQFAIGGQAQGGLVARAIAMAAPLARAGQSARINPDWHRPLRQTMVLTRGAGPIARRFRDWILDRPGRAVLERHGFELPAA